MNYYQEITLINSIDGTLFKLWSKVFMQVHLALVESKDDNDQVDFGISFPEYQQFEKNGKNFSILGSKLRVFANHSTELEQLGLQQHLKRLLDYVHIRSISAVPEPIKGHLTVNRCRQDGNMERLTRRYAKRKNITFDQAKNEQVANYAEKNKVSIEKALESYENPKLQNHPYIIIDSLSSNNKFSLEIKQIPVEKPQEGMFNTYGMSATTTVPHW